MELAVWFISDLHVGHRFVAHLRGFAPKDGPESVFADGVAKHDQTLADNWDAVVKPDDDVWVLGDISGGGSGSQKRALEWLKERPGRKHLIAGNHDGVHPMYRDSGKWQKLYLEVFDTVQPFARRRIAGESVLLSHFPYFGDGEGSRDTPERYSQYRLPDMGEWLIHGHVHDPIRLRGKSIHVGVDAWNLAPVHLDEIVKLIESQELSQSA